MSWTPEQLRTLSVEAAKLAAMANHVSEHPSSDWAEQRIALAARRIAEIVMPQDLIYKP